MFTAVCALTCFLTHEPWLERNSGSSKFCIALQCGLWDWIRANLLHCCHGDPGTAALRNTDASGPVRGGGTRKRRDTPRGAAPTPPDSLVPNKGTLAMPGSQGGRRHWVLPQRSSKISPLIYFEGNQAPVVKARRAFFASVGRGSANPSVLLFRDQWQAWKDNLALTKECNHSDGF